MRPSPVSQNLTSASVTLQASKLSPEAKGQRRRPDPIALLLNWMYRDEDEVEVLEAVRREDKTNMKHMLELGVDIDTRLR